MFQIRNIKTEEIVNVYQLETVPNEYSDIDVDIYATVYGKDRGWDSIELDDDWEPLEIPNVPSLKKKPSYHTPFGVGGVGDIDVGEPDCGRGFIPADNKLSI